MARRKVLKPSKPKYRVRIVEERWFDSHYKKHMRSWSVWVWPSTKENGGFKGVGDTLREAWICVYHQWHSWQRGTYPFCSVKP